MSDHVALIVGASRGIGRAVAESFAARGAHLALVARDRARLEAVAAALPGPPALVEAADAAERGALEAALARTLERFGRIDTAINLAAANGPLGLPLWDLPAEHWERVLATNVTALGALVRAVVPAMLRQGRGLLIAASSPFGDALRPGLGAYGVSRAGCNHLVRQLAAELEGTGVGACLVLPGITDTEGLAAFRKALGGAAGQAPAEPPEAMAELFAWCAMHRPDEINGATVSWSDPAVRAGVAALARVGSGG